MLRTEPLVLKSTDPRETGEKLNAEENSKSLNTSQQSKSDTLWAIFQLI